MNPRALFNKCPLFAYELNIGLILCPKLLFLFFNLLIFLFCFIAESITYVSCSSFLVACLITNHFKYIIRIKHTGIALPGKAWQEPAPTLRGNLPWHWQQSWGTRFLFQRRTSALSHRRSRRWEEGESARVGLVKLSYWRGRKVPFPWRLWCFPGTGVKRPLQECHQDEGRTWVPTMTLALLPSGPEYTAFTHIFQVLSCFLRQVSLLSFIGKHTK